MNSEIRVVKSDGTKVVIDLDKIHITNGSRQETLRIPG